MFTSKVEKMSVFSRLQRFILFFVTSLMIFAQLSNCQSRYWYDRCGKLFECGELKNVGYPFYGKDRFRVCGYPGFELTCDDNVPHIIIRSIVYRVLKIEGDSFTVAREDLWNSSCTTQFADSTLDFSLFAYTNSQPVKIFYNCSGSTFSYQSVNCNTTGLSFYVATGEPLDNSVKCENRVTVNVSPEAGALLVDIRSNETTLRSALTSGFMLRFSADNERCKQCTESSGRCGYAQEFFCSCPDGEYPLTCNVGRDTTSHVDRTAKYVKPTVIGIAIILGAGGIALLSFTSYNRRAAQQINNIDAEYFMKQFSSAGPKHYSYAQIKKMTNSFADKLGEGGYGSVYKGKLPDGSLVAVKVLSGIKGNGEDFINEVASISRTSHVNIVTLLGFCVHKDRRALIFQFMPNGSLDKFVNRKLSPECAIAMDCKTQFKIAVGTARGLEYLHRGCNTRIVHFDIKPHNILLDEEFCPKISDFGLAKLSETKDSMFSKFSARGTIGYIAPEMIFRNFGSVSSKSDVYSYGMMILEMVGARNKPNIEVERSSQLYFPNWIYEQLELGKDLEIRVLEDSVEEEIERKLILVGLWCIQTKPSDRPSMSKVVEMLEGSLDSLRFPPKPLLYSPEVSPQESPEMSPQQSSTSLS